MALLDLFKKNTPKTAKANFKGGDVEPIGADNAYKPSKNFVKDEKALAKGRRGVVSTKKYSSTPKQ